MIRLLYNFLNDAAIITSSSQVSTLPDDNVVNDFVTKVWRATGDSAEWIKFNLESPKTIKQVSIFGHNLTDQAVVTIEASSDDDWEGPGDPEYSSGELTWKEFGITKFLDEHYQYWRITIVDGDNPDEYIEVGRICLGAYYEPTVNFSETYTKELKDPSIINMSQGRQAHAVERSLYRVYKVRFDLIPRAALDELRDIFRVIGRTGYCVVALDPDSYPSVDTIYSLLVTDLSKVLTALDYGNVSLTFEEKVR